MLGAFVIGDEPGTGFAALGIMVALGALFFFGGRSETLRGLGGPGRDGSPYAQLGAVGGLAYVIAVVVLRARS